MTPADRQRIAEIRERADRTATCIKGHGPNAVSLDVPWLLDRIAELELEESRLRAVVEENERHLRRWQTRANELLQTKQLLGNRCCGLKSSYRCNVCIVRDAITAMVSK